ncbi:MAG: hypothetical protein WC217_03815, partial [Candidatus Paceibacterota bacterium]
VATLFVTALTLAAMALLVPTYVLLGESSRAKTARLANIESVLSSSDESVLSARVAALSSNTAALSALRESPSASSVIRSVLDISRPGVTLSDFSYQPTRGTVPGTLTVSGVAATRDSLRSYQLLLSGASFVRVANLPVSAYAKDSDIDFTITLALAP